MTTNDYNSSKILDYHRARITSFSDRTQNAIFHIYGISNDYNYRDIKLKQVSVAPAQQVISFQQQSD